MKTVYLDHAATTPVDPRVMEAIKPYFSKIYGNPSSVHRLGQQSEAALEGARQQIAESIAAHPEEIIFTCCGTESDNLALRGTALAARRSRGARRILTSPLEHPAVAGTAEQLATLFDFEITWLETDDQGLIGADIVREQLDKDVALVSLMQANNEVGTLNPIAEIGQICREAGIPFHSDAVQSAAHFPLDVDHLAVDLLSLGAHKFYGPKGVGALYIRRGTEILPIQTGGSQEYGLRAATENVPLCVGMAKAFQLVQEEHQERREHCLLLRNQIITTVLRSIPGSQLTGHPEKRLPNHASFIFSGVDCNLLVSVLDSEGFACSSGSACKTGSPQPSSVLLGLGFSRSQALGSLRVTVGKDTSEEDVARFLAVLPDCVQRVRELS